MSDQPVIEGNAQPPASAPPTSIGSTTDRSIYSVVALCSLCTIGCFFLPWIRILFTDLSGYQLQQLPSNGVKLLWLIPITSGIAFFAAFTKKSVCIASQMAGTMPALALLYYWAKLGGDIFQALRPGAYLTLILAAVLFIAPRRLK